MYKKIILIVIIVLIGLGIAFYFVFFDKQEEKGSQNTVKEKNIGDGKENTNKKQPEALCAGLSGSSASQCYLEEAQKTKNPEFCQKIHDDNAKQLCLYILSSEQAKADNDIKKCQEIPFEDIKKNCQDEIFKKSDSISLCDVIENSDQKSLCQTDFIKYKVKESNTNKACNQLYNPEDQKKCMEYAEGIIDVDNDGLTNYYEKQYGTDPNNPDTDKDGYTDYDEIKAGYNPKGKGKLN